MSNWTSLIAPVDPELAQIMTLDKVTANRAGDRFIITMTASRLLTGDEFRNMEAVFQKALTRANVKLRVSYPALKRDVLSDAQSVRPFITSLIARDNPGAKVHLSSPDDWSIEDGRLSIHVNDQFGVDFISRQEIDARIAHLFKVLFDVDVRVAVEIAGDTEKRIRDIAQKRKQEADRISEAAAQSAMRSQKTAEKPPSEQALGKPITDEEIPLSQLSEGKGRLVVKGQVISFEDRELANGATMLVTFSITDFTGSVSCKAFIGGKRSKSTPEQVKAQYDNLATQVKVGSWVKVRGDYIYDEYQREPVIRATDIMRVSVPQREDNSVDKRVE
ncbi:MAG: hypothetical protein Q4D04_00055, partial [Clostridia bacterium]|nr:hypothetical protein [Clostridia bacterium]